MFSKYRNIYKQGSLMKISSFLIKNFRSYKEELIHFDNYNAFVGANGSGKSTVLAALNVFFGESGSSSIDYTELEIDDFHKKDISKPIELTITFDDLTTEEQTDLKDYYRQGKLIITAKAIFDENTQKAPVSQFGARLGMTEFAHFFKSNSDGAKAADLKVIYAALKTKYDQLPSASTKDGMIDALREFEASKPELCIEIPSHDQFYGISKVGKLNKFIQWVYIPAVKDASDEQRDSKNSALGKLLSRTVDSKSTFDQKIKEIAENAKKEYQKALEENQKLLDNVSGNLKNRLLEWAHPDINLKVEWAGDSQKAVLINTPYAHLKVGEGDFEGQLNRLGHGLQRSYIIALLQELASMPVNEKQPKLILGCEEPELYQHPPQSRYLSGVLTNLAAADSQIIMTTHSPHFINGSTFHGVKICKQSNNVTKVTSFDNLKFLEEAKKYERSITTPTGIKAKLYQVLQPHLSEMFFAKKVIFVEGIEDQAFILSAITVFDKLDVFRKAGAHIVPVNGKNHLISPLIIAKIMGINSFVVFDADGDTEDKDGKRTKQEKDNTTILKILSLDEKIAPFPDQHQFETNAVVWKHNIGDAFQQDCGDKFIEIKTTVEQELGQIGSLEKNMLAVAEKVYLAKTKDIDLKNINQLVDAIVKFCETA